MAMYILELRKIVEVDGISTIQWATLVRSNTREIIDDSMRYFSTIHQQKHLRVRIGV